MNKDWPLTPIGSFLTQVWREEAVNPGREYRFLGVRWYGEGLFTKALKAGHGIRASSVYRVQTGDFVYNRLFAWKGSFAVAGKDMDGAYVSNEFPCFVADHAHLDPCFLLWYFRRESAWSQALGLSAGATPTSRNRLKECLFLKMQLPLPPIAEQRRIVGRIEELMADIEAARRLRTEAVGEAEALVDRYKAALFSSHAMQKWRIPIGKSDLVLNKESRNPTYEAQSFFLYVDISAVGPGPRTITKARSVSKEEVPSRARRVIHKNDVLISTVRPNLRAFVKVGQELDNQICSTGFAVFTCGESIIPDFFLHQCCSPIFVDECMARATGGHYPAINDKNLKNVEIVCPPISEQHRTVTELDGLQAEVGALKAAQAETAAELDALLPSILDRAFKGELL